MWLTIVIITNIMGAVMVAKHDSMMANKIWFVTNPILIGHNFLIGQYEQSGMFAIYWILTILGISKVLK